MCKAPSPPGARPRTEPLPVFPRLSSAVSSSTRFPLRLLWKSPGEDPTGLGCVTTALWGPAGVWAEAEQGAGLSPDGGWGSGRGPRAAARVWGCGLLLSLPVRLALRLGHGPGPASIGLLLLPSAHELHAVGRLTQIADSRPKRLGLQRAVCKSLPARLTASAPPLPLTSSPHLHRHVEVGPGDTDIPQTSPPGTPPRIGCVTSLWTLVQKKNPLRCYLSLDANFILHVTLQ